MNEITLNEFQIVAKQFMKEIQYDNGCVNRFEKEKYPKEWLDKISRAVEVFLRRNSDFEFNDEIIQHISCREVNQVKKRFGRKNGFDNLYNSLNEYFSSL